MQAAAAVGVTAVASPLALGAPFREETAAKQASGNEAAIQAAPILAPDAPPGGYNILFILVDQEHFFENWPMPVP